ncbi:ATP-dependent Clp protease proteolytic subunit [Streptomyces sp. NPDC053367]|uniref:ATP-dependent Clp protease proteolytic subunit n=1 Tax=Streptomyces sp. NPDC053367 TaxID=3365700 RepID=UPI0037D4C6D4
MSPPSARHVLPAERTGSGPGTGDPYTKLREERIVLLGTRVDDTSANDVTAQFMYLEHRDPDRDISLHLYSPGGSYSAMTAVHDTMRSVGCDVEAVCLGQAGTAAAVLLAAGTPGRRLALPGARITLRQPALGEPVEGQAGDPAGRARELPRTRAGLEEMPARHTGRRREQVRADIEHDRVLTAQEALEYGLVDRIVPARAAALAPPDGE